MSSSAVEYFSLVNLTRGCTLANRVRKAQNFWERAKGLMGRSSLEEGEGLLIEPCNWIHTLGMAFPIDVLYLDDELAVTHVCYPLCPNRLGPLIRRAHSVLELPAGTIVRSGTKIGDRLSQRDPVGEERSIEATS